MPVCSALSENYSGRFREMKAASVILAHPYENSFNHAIYRRAVTVLEKKGIRVYAHDLYTENFDPVMPVEELGKQETRDALVKKYVEEMLDSDLLVFVHPNWWGQPPAILKGYVDRVFRPPYAYDEANPDEAGIGKLQGKTGIVFNTGNTDSKREAEYFNDPLQYEWLRCIFGFCGITRTERKLFRIIAGSSEVQRKTWLQDVEKTIEKYV
jgi:putative NADPH-quinone reductase